VVGELGNPGLGAPRSVHATLGAEHTLLEGIDLELAGFYKRLDQQVIRNPAFFFNPAALPYLNGGTGRIWGVELLIKARVERFSGWLAYTYQRSLRTDGPGAAERPFDFDQPHNLVVVGSYAFGAGWSAGLRFRLVSGSPATPVVGAVYDASSGTWVPLFGETNSDRAGTFHQLDLRIDKRWTYDLWKLSLYLDVQNVYNRKNPEGTQYNFDYSERQPLTGLPILPILGVKGEW
jgi:outer membrane receptor protein involved in Fe transport